MDKQEFEKLGEILSEKVTETTKGIQEGVSDCTKAIDAIREEQRRQSEEITTLKSKNAVSVPGLEEEKKNGKDFSFAKACLGIATGDWQGRGFEHEVLTSAKQKALSYGTAADGGYVVPEEYINDMIELIRSNTVIDKLGVTNITPSFAPVKIPKQTGGATAYWVSENAEITQSQQTFDEVSLEPKMVAGITPMSRRIAELSDPSMEAIVRRDIAQVIARAIDIKALEGDGTNDTPTGILNTSNILTYSVGTDGDAVNYALFSELEGLLEDNDTLKGNLAFVALPKIFRKLKNQRIAQFSGQTDGEYIIPPLVSNAELAQALGYSFESTTQIDATGTKGDGTNLTSIYFGNWQDMVKAMWGSLILDATTSGAGAFEKHQILIKAVAEVDVAVRHPESFAVATDVITA